MSILFYSALDLTILFLNTSGELTIQALFMNSALIKTLLASVAGFEDGQTVCPENRMPWHISVMHGSASVAPNPETHPVWLFGTPLAIHRP